jgi:hypothetical protein
MVYERRRPENGTLHRVVRENLLTLYAATEAGETAAPLPSFVRKELEGYLDCGRLSRGFAVLACQSCDERRVIAFSCKSRAFCPSCLGRRMAQTAFNLLDHVLPRVPLRQWVLTLPHPLRQRIAYDRELLGSVGRIFVSSVLGFYRRRLSDAGGKPTGKGGAVVVVQRTSADLKLNPHLHAVFLDGVYLPGDDPQPVFVALPSLSTSDVADVLQAVRARILRHLVRKRVIELGPDLTLGDDGCADREPALAHLAAATVSGLPPAGPEVRRRPPIALRGRPGVVIAAPLSVADLGFSLHAATRAGAHDPRSRQALVKYILRPPVADEHLRLLPDDLVRIQLKRPFRDGTYAVDLDPLSLLTRLCAAVPPPRQHTIRYAGVLAAAAKWRAAIVPVPPSPDGDTALAPAAAPPANGPGSAPAPPTHRSRYRPWIALLRRTFALDLRTCESCGGPTKVIALVTDPLEVARFLRHLGEPTDPPPLSPARAPPYFKSRLLRHKPMDQPVLFAQ